MTTVFVNEHEYLKMVRAREDRIRTFMQLELEACLEEVSWSIRCYNCEVLGCPQEEYPARLLPTLPPDYEDNLINRLGAAQKGILPASLKMILNSDYQLPVLRSASQVSVQPDSVIWEHRVEQVSMASECDLSPRHAADVVCMCLDRCCGICGGITQNHQSVGRRTSIHDLRSPNLPTE